tara:strand:+ start:1166 stop:1342 length:177 start_codon:yes stop_codon:yes gene_type:complete
MGIYGTYFINLSNEEKFVLADFAASKVEKSTGVKMTAAEYEAFVWDFIQTVAFAHIEE